MTKKEAVENHRKMWRWIAEETVKRKSKVFKKEYFIENNIVDNIFCDCYCCDYVRQLDVPICEKCPVKWPYRNYCGFNSLMQVWAKSEDYEVCAKTALAISELRERKTQFYDIR